ncbi:hypothetical protein Bca4012_059400 [Brassica carinata]
MPTKIAAIKYKLFSTSLVVLLVEDVSSYGDRAGNYGGNLVNYGGGSGGGYGGDEADGQGGGGYVASRSGPALYLQVVAMDLAAALMPRVQLQMQVLPVVIMEAVVMVVAILTVATMVDSLGTTSLEETRDSTQFGSMEKAEMENGPVGDYADETDVAKRA